MKYRHPRGLIVTSIKRSQVKKEIIVEKKDVASRYVNAFPNSSSFKSVEGKGFKEQMTPKPLSCLRVFLFVISQSNNTRHIPFSCPETLNVYKRKRKSHDTCRKFNWIFDVPGWGKYQKIKLAPSVVIVSPRSNSQIIRTQIF